jgi:DNA-binding GntR family transcriptional regulator
MTQAPARRGARAAASGDGGPGPRPTAQQLAYHFLRERILSGHFEAGMRLRPEQLAAEIGVSRMPVREAVRQLDAEGLLTTLPNRGVVVSRLTPEEVVELFEIRAALEGLAARLAVDNVSEDALLDLEHLITRMRRAEHDHLLWIERHDVLHAQICRLSGRERLCRLAAQLRVQVQPYLRLFTSGARAPELGDFRHELIVEALGSRDPDRAERAMREHVTMNASEIAQCVREARTGE